MGINVQIPINTVEKEAEENLRVEVLTAHKGNHVSFVEAKEDAEVVLQRYLDKEFAEKPIRRQVQPVLKRRSLSRLGWAGKRKRDGTRKLRIIVDLHRSGVNARTLTPQRLVLPRIGDAVESLRDLMEGREQGTLQDEGEWLAAQVPDETWKELGVLAAEEPGGKDSVDTTVADVSDTYGHLRTPPTIGRAFCVRLAVPASGQRRGSTSHGAR